MQFEQGGKEYTFSSSVQDRRMYHFFHSSDWQEQN